MDKCRKCDAKYSEQDKRRGGKLRMYKNQEKIGLTKGITKVTKEKGK